jgi:hypothetical protein
VGAYVKQRRLFPKAAYLVSSIKNIRNGRVSGRLESFGTEWDIGIEERQKKRLVFVNSKTNQEAVLLKFVWFVGRV